MFEEWVGPGEQVVSEMNGKTTLFAQKSSKHIDEDQREHEYRKIFQKKPNRGSQNAPDRLEPDDWRSFQLLVDVMTDHDTEEGD